MKLLKHLSLISSAALVSTSMFARVAPKNKDIAAENETPVVTEEKAEKKAVANENKDDTTLTTKDSATQDKKVVPTREQISAYFRTLGWMTIMHSGINNLDPKAEDIKAFEEGVSFAFAGKESPEKLGEIMQPMQSYFQERAGEFEKKHQEELKMTAEKNRKLGDDFMKDLLKKDASIKTTSSGLSYKILAEGDGKVKASDEDSVEIYYTGKLIDGKVFDESKSKTVVFPLNGVVPGIKEGLQLIGQGGKITLYIPDNLAYGEYDIPSIPAGSRLIFDVELVKIEKAEKAPASVAEAGKDDSAKETIENK